MKRLFKLTLAALATLPVAAQASTPGYVTTIGVNAYGIAFFTHSGTRYGVPSCQNAAFPDRYVFDASSTYGQIMLTNLLSAYYSHRLSVINGLGTCPVWNDSEAPSEAIAVQ